MEIDRSLLIKISIKVIIFIICLSLSLVLGLTEYNNANSIAYKTSFLLIKNNVEIQKVFGDRIRRDWLLQGTPFPNKEDGRIHFAYSIIGKVRASVYVNAMQLGSELNEVSIVVKIENVEKEIVIKE